MAFSQNALLKENPNGLVQQSANPPLWLSPPPSGTISETLDAVFDTISLLSPIKGFSAAMLLPDGSVWKRSSGLAQELPSEVPLSTDHLLGMGSITKLFIATTLLKLMEEGMFSLDDSIGQYLAPFPNVSGSITIRQLLSHRSGLYDYANQNPASFGDWAANPSHIFTAEEILNTYVLAPNFPPDSSWAYSNTNYLLAGLLLESLTGQAWPTIVRQRILNPYGLIQTYVYPWKTPVNQPFAHVFEDLNGDGVIEDVQGSGTPMEGLFSLANSSGCLLTAPKDLVKFLGLLFSGQVLQPATLAAMQFDYEQDGSGFLYGLGLGSFPLPQNIENWGHTGGIIYQSAALFFPTENIALAVQQNDGRFYDPSDPNSSVYDLYFMVIALLDAYLNYEPQTKVTELNFAQSVELVPNPASHSCALQFPEDYTPNFPLQIVLSDVLGRNVYTKTLENVGEEISIAHLPPGIYSVKAGTITGKLVKRLD